MHNIELQNIRDDREPTSSRSLTQGTTHVEENCQIVFNPLGCRIWGRIFASAIVLGAVLLTISAVKCYDSVYEDPTPEKCFQFNCNGMPGTSTFNEYKNCLQEQNNCYIEKKYMRNQWYETHTLEYVEKLERVVIGEKSYDEDSYNIGYVKTILFYISSVFITFLCSYYIYHDWNGTFR